MILLNSVSRFFGSPWNIVGPFLAIGTRTFDLIAKPRLKSGPSFSANGALSLNPGEPPWVVKNTIASCA